MIQLDSDRWGDAGVLQLANNTDKRYKLCAFAKFDHFHADSGNHQKKLVRMTEQCKFVLQTPQPLIVGGG